MRAEEHREAGGAAREDDLVQRPAGRGIEAGGRFVEHEHARCVHKRERECEPLLLAAGKGVERGVRLFVQREFGEQRGDVRPRPVERAEQPQGLTRRDLVGQGGGLELGAE